MTTLVQTAPNGVVIEGGWYPVVAWAVRSTDNAVIGRVADWRGGAGNRPPIGWIRDDGTLTDDPDEAWAFPGQAVDVAGARGSLRGALSASMAVAAGSAQGETAADWTDVATGFSANNGLPGDVRAKLRIPNTRLAGQLGWLIEAERDGETRAIVLAWGEYTGSAGTALPTAVGEALTIRYRANFEDNSGDWFEVAVRAGPLAEAATVRLYPALNGAGAATDAQLAALRADVANVERELSQIHDLPNTGGVTLSELLRRLADYETVADAAATHRALTQRVKSISVANGQLHVVTVDAEGAETTTAITLGTDAGATQAHTDAQITALAGALISTLPEFSWDAAARSLTFRPDPPPSGSITEAMLAEALANTLAGKLDAADVLDAAKRTVRALSPTAAASFRARIGLDDDAPNALPYAGVARGAWDFDTTTGGAGVLADTGVDVEPADVSVSFGDATVAVAQLPANAAGYNGNTDSSRVHAAQIDGVDWFFALDGLRVLAAPNEARSGTLPVSAAGYRVEDAGDRNKPTARWSKRRLPPDIFYGVPPDIAAIDARIGAAFRAGVLRGATVAKAQNLFDIVLGGEWAAATAAGDDLATHPAVSSAVRSTPWTANAATAAAYVAEGATGPHVEHGLICVRVPAALHDTLATLRVRAGADDYDPEDPDEIWVRLVGARLVTRTAEFHYYEVDLGDVPAAITWSVQRGNPIRIDPRLASARDDRIPDLAGRPDDDMLYVLDGVLRVGAPPLSSHVSSLGVLTPGLTLAQTNTDTRRQAALWFDPAFDPDDEANAAALLLLSIDVAIAPTGNSPNLGLEYGNQNATAEQRRRRVLQMVPVAELLAADAWTSNTDIGGVKVRDLPAWTLTTLSGHWRLYLVRDDTNGAGLFSLWKGESGAVGATITTTVRTFVIR